MKTLTQTPITKGQLTLITRMIGDVANSEPIQKALSSLDKDSAEHLKGNPEFIPSLHQFVLKSITDFSVTNQYVDEMVDSNYNYPLEYRGPKPIAEQVKTISTMFGLDPIQALDFIKTLPALPDGAEGWFAIPKVSSIAKKHFPAITDSTEQYCEAVKLVHSKLAENRSFFNNYREGQITTAQIRQHPRTLSFLEQLESGQQGDILILAVQYGMRHRGKSVRRARETFSSNEFGLGAFALGCMALIHPERYVRWEELDTDCAGDEFSLDGDSDLSRSPFLHFGDGELEFDAGGVSGAGGGYGSASGFLP